MSQEKEAILNQIAQELKNNLIRAITKYKAKSPCTNVVNKFIEQLSEGEFTKHDIRKIIPKAIAEVKSEVENINYPAELITISYGQEYLDKESGLMTRKEYRQHFIITKLYETLNLYGLVKGNESGIFTLDNKSIETDNKKAETVNKDVENVKKTDTKPKKKKDLIEKVGIHDAINFTKYLITANSLLESNDWREKIVGLQMAIPRRDAEIGLQMDFYADTKFSVVISTPSKKRGENNTFYRVPCFIDSAILCKALTFVRENKPELTSDILKDFGDNNAANKAYNNDESKRIEAVFNSVVRALLPTSANSKNKDNRHQLKNIGTSALKQIKANSLGNLVGQEHLIDEWIKNAVAHKYQETTDKYITWNITNIPKELSVIADSEYREVSPDYIGKEIDTNETQVNDLSALITAVFNIASDDADKLSIANKIFMHENKPKSVEDIAKSLNRIFDSVIESQSLATKTHKALGLTSAKSKVETRLEALIDSLILHNQSCEDDALRVHINESSIRNFYKIFPGKDGKEGTVNFNTVKQLFSNNSILKVKIDDANKDLKADNNIRGKVERYKILENIRLILGENFPDVL
jgi:Telomere resolvase